MVLFIYYTNSYPSSLQMPVVVVVVIVIELLIFILLCTSIDLRV